MALAHSAFAHADTKPSAAQLLLQALTPPTPFIPYYSPAAPTSAGASIKSAAPQVPIGISLSNLVTLDANLIPQNAIIPGGGSPATSASATPTAPF